MMGCRAHDGRMRVFEGEGCRMKYAGMQQAEWLKEWA